MEIFSDVLSAIVLETELEEDVLELTEEIEGTLHTSGSVVSEAVYFCGNAMLTLRWPCVSEM